MSPGRHILWGSLLLLATSLLINSAVGERHIRRITSADLPTPSNSSSSARNTVVKAPEPSPVPDCPSGSTNGSCSEALAEEAKRKAKDKLPELSSDGTLHVVEPSPDETVQERVHAGHVLHLSSATPHHRHQDGGAPHQEPTTPSEEGRRSTFRHPDVSELAGGVTSPLTTPRLSLFDDRFLRVSESIRQNLEELEEQHAFHSTATPSSEHRATTSASSFGSVPPTVALEYTNHVSIQYNDSRDPPRSLRKDIVVENGTRVEFTSSFIHTEHYDDFPTTIPPISSTGSDSHSLPSKSNNTNEDNSVQEANLSEDKVQHNISAKYAEQNPVSNLENAKDIHNNTVPPGDSHSTTTSRPPSRSHATTVDSRLNRRRYTTKKLQISALPTSTEAIPSRVRSGVRRTNNSTTSDTESSTLPPAVATNRTRARMISSAKYQGNATNSVEEPPTLTPVGINGQSPRRKQTTRYSWRRPANRTGVNSEEGETELPMVRIQISTVQPSSSEKALDNDTSKDDVAFTTQATRFVKRRQNATATDDKRTLISSNEVVVRNSTKPLRSRGSIKYAGLSNLTGGDRMDSLDSLVIPPTAAAWALASLRGPVDSEVGGAVRRPSSDDAGEMTTEEAETTTETLENTSTAQPGTSKPISSGTTTNGPVDDLLPLGFITTQRAFEEVGATARSDVIQGSDGIQNNDVGLSTTTITSSNSASSASRSTTTPGSESILNNDVGLSTTTIASSNSASSTSRPTTTPAPDSILNNDVGLSTATTTSSNSATSVSRSTTTPAPDSILNNDVGLSTATYDAVTSTFHTTPTPGVISIEPSDGGVSPTTTVASSEMARTEAVTSPYQSTSSDESTEESVFTTTIVPSEMATSVSQTTATPERDEAGVSTPTSVPLPMRYHEEGTPTPTPEPEAGTRESEVNSTESTSQSTLTPEPGFVQVNDVGTQKSVFTTTISSQFSTAPGQGVVEHAPTTIAPVEATAGRTSDQEAADELEEGEVLDTTLPPTTTAVPDLAEDDQDYVGDVDPPATAQPRPQLPNTTPPTTTSSTSPPTTTVQTTTEGAETTTVMWPPAFGDISSYLRVTVFSSWDQVCQQERSFREALANLLVDKTERKLSAQNVVLANVAASQCESVVSSDKELIDVNVFVLNEEGVFSRELNDMFYLLVAAKDFPSPLEISHVELLHGALPTTSDSSNAGVIAAITISCIGAVSLLLLAVLLIIMRKRQKRFSYGQRCTPVSLDAYSLDSVSVYDSVRRKGGVRASKRSYGNPGFDDPGAPSHPVNFAGLANFSSDRAALEEEFAMVPQVSPKSDELPEGAETKNRYSNVIPLPETRVPLAPVDGEQLSDYINANYVRGPKNEQKFYIACQAPLQSTVTDFWRMVWEQQSKVIVMLTDLVENGVEKCADYLPPSEVLDCHRLFGDFQITLKKREERDKYVISTLQLKNLESNLWREVTHLWYLSWPHQGVPEECSSIIAFLIEARPYMKANTGPNIVHCSPGTGRTGTVLACDICIREFELTRMVDIPRCVYRLRRDRAGAVKTRDQYVFIYQVLNTYATKLTGGGGLDSI